MRYWSLVPALLLASVDCSEYLIVKNGCAPLVIRDFESLEPSHLTLCCHAPIHGPNMAASLQAFCTRLLFVAF